MSVWCSRRDVVVFCARSLVRFSKVASFFGFLGFLENINGAAILRRPPRVDSENDIKICTQNTINGLDLKGRGTCHETYFVNNEFYLYLEVFLCRE